MTNKIYAGGLPLDTVDEELKTFFQQAGTVRSATVITHAESGRSKGFGFVEMSTAAEMQRAISWLPLRDRRIEVHERLPESASAAAPPSPPAALGAWSGRTSETRVWC
ncbi:MAG: RNA-binding protein [Dehalococcoidia bacterium]|nr:RNA-binding protein [Dehalococcoidia bacterium]